METETENQLKQCFDLLFKIQAEYPNGEFDREMIHGDMDFRFKRIKQLRDKLETFPTIIHKFAKFIDSIHVPEAIKKSIFRSIIEQPERYMALVGLKFTERRKRIAAWAMEMNIPAASIDELLTRSRLSGILEADYRLNETYRDVIIAYRDD